MSRTTSIFSAISMVRDREFRFLCETLVARVSRPALGFGEAPGRASVATVRGPLMPALAPQSGCG